MALETLLVKVKTAIPPKLLMKKKPSFKIRHHHKQTVGVLSFEVAGTISKLLHLYHSLSDSSSAVPLDGVRKIVADDKSFLLGLARAELAESLRVSADSVSRLASRCSEPSLRSFRRSFQEFADSGRDPNGWAQSAPKEAEAKARKLERYVTLTATLYREMEELSVLENGLKKIVLNHNKNKSNSSENNNNSNNEGSFTLKDQQKAYEIQHKIFFQRQEVKDLKERSLWSRTFDNVVTLLARFCFAVLARVKIVFGVGHVSPCLSRSSSSCSATVYPSDHQNATPSGDSDSGSLKSLKLYDDKDEEEEEEGLVNFGESSGFFESHCKVLKPASTTLGAHALALHYANLIIVLEKMIKSPQLVGADARDDLYSMLPNTIRCALRGRLRGIGFCASDPVLAGEWRDALGRILGWLYPLAHNMIRWQSERSFEKHSSNYLVMKSSNSVLLMHTLFFADKLKAEAAITELLVGFNYIWRFEREMTAKAFFEYANFNGFVNLHKFGS